MSKEFVREGMAKRMAQEYIARLLLDEGEHAQAFDDEAISAAEKQAALAEIRAIGISFIPKHNAEI